MAADEVASCRRHRRDGGRRHDAASARRRRIDRRRLGGASRRRRHGRSRAAGSAAASSPARPAISPTTRISATSRRRTPRSRRRRTRLGSGSSIRASSPTTWSRAPRSANTIATTGRFTLNARKPGRARRQGRDRGLDPEDPAGVASRRHPGRRRRFRHQGLRLSRISARSRGRQAARTPGRLAGRSHRAFRRRRARPRQRDDGRNGARRRGPVSRLARRYPRQSRRLSLACSRPIFPGSARRWRPGPTTSARSTRAFAAFTPIRFPSTPIAARGGPRRPTCSSDWSTFARGRSASRPKRCARATSSSPTQMPYHTQTDRDYDVGDFEGAMRACLEKADRAGFARRAEDRAGARQDPRVRRFELYRMHRLERLRDRAPSTLEKNGDFTVLIGTQSNGQGHETAYAQVVSQYLDVPLDRIKVIQGDTDRDRHRRRDRRIAIHSDRRGDGDARVANSRRFAQGSGGRQARGRGRRPGNRGRTRAHRRHRPRDLLCRDRRPAFARRRRN